MTSRAYSPRSTARHGRILVVAVVVGFIALSSACLRPHATPPVLRVGTSGDYPPFSAARAGSFQGFDVDVAAAFAHDTGRRLELVRFRWRELARDVAEGRIDLAMSGVTMRPERALVGHFSRPVAETAGTALARRGVARTPAELDRPGLRIAVNAGGHLERLARRLFPRATLVPVENESLARILRTGGVDALMTDDVEAEDLETVLPDVVELGPLSRDRKAYLGRDPTLVRELDQWLRTREADGILAALRARWLGSGRADTRSAFESDVDALVALIDLRLALMPTVAAAKERAGRPVEDVAQETRVREAVTRRATEVGLEPASIAPLFEALIGAARAVQETYLAAPPERRVPVEPADLERDLRPALASLSDDIVARAADVARDQAALASLNVPRVAARLDTVLSSSTRTGIAQAFLPLRRSSGAVENQRL